MRVTRVLLVMVCFAIFLVQLIPPAICDEINGLTYEMRFMGQQNDRGSNEENQMYFPTGLKADVYDLDSFAGPSRLISNDFRPAPYPIYVWYKVWVNDQHGFLCNIRNNAWFRISICNSQRVILEQKVYRSGHDFEITNYEEEPIEVPANHGIYVQMFTGHFTHSHHADHGFNCWYKINYQLDSAPPNPPDGLSAEKTGEGGLIVDPGGIYTNYNQITFHWNEPSDSKTTYNGFTYGPGGVTGYRLFRNEVALNNWSPGTEATIAIPEEGLCKIQVKARDFDDNRSDYSTELTLIVDRTVSLANLPANPVTITGNKADFSWNKVNDLSGINVYQVALTETETPPESGIIILSAGSNRYRFDQELDGKKCYFAWVRAKDKLGNVGQWKKTGPFALYPQPAQLTSAVPTAVRNQSGEAEYQVALTVTDANAARYVFSRAIDGNPVSRVILANLSYQEMAATGFQYIDQSNLVKRGQYRYFVSAQNPQGESAPESSLSVVIPNLATEFTITGPVNGTVSSDRSHLIDIAPKQDPEGDEVKFRVCYKLGEKTYYSDSIFKSDPVTLNLADGNWEWWIEAAEYNNGIEIPGTVLTTSHRSLQIQGSIPLAVALPPYFEATVGNPVTLAAIALQLNGTPVDYSWNPGDGSGTLSGVAPEHTYTETGERTVTLTVTDSLSQTYQGSTMVMVSNTTKGTLAVNETWSGTHRIYGDVIVPVGKTLTIEPGTEVIVDGLPGESADHAIIVQGSLTAPGGGSNVIFRSASGIPGSWKGIKVEGAATLSGVTIQEAKRGLSVVAGASVTVNNCTFQSNGMGLHAYGGAPRVNGSSFIDNVFYGIKEDEGGCPIVTNCYFSGNGMDYYHETQTELTMEQLNGLTGNYGNHH